MYRLLVSFGSALFLALLCFGDVTAQTASPVNSNYLIARGVSPRVLDFAANSVLQDGRFNEDIILTVELPDGETNTYEFQSIYDQAYTDGMDMRFVVDGAKATRADIKLLTDALKELHTYGRLVEQYLYDEGSLELISDENGVVVFEYDYRKTSLDPSMAQLKRLRGRVQFTNGDLDFVEVFNTRPLKNNIDDYTRRVYFQEPSPGGGHFVARVVETYTARHDGQPVQLTVEVTTTEYANAKGEILYSSPTADLVQSFEMPDTISVRLGGLFPLFGKPATKLGYQLPRPVGVSGLVHLQAQQLQFTGLSIGLNGGELIRLSDVFLLEESSLEETTSAYSVKGDLWVFPFLNVMAMVGYADNKVNGELVLTDEIKALLGILGVEDVPDAIPIIVDTNANLFSLGGTLAGGIDNFNGTLNYQGILANVPDVNATTIAHAATAMVGYMTPFGMNIMGGIQGQWYDPAIGGSIDLDPGNSLEFNVEFEPSTWNFFGGIYHGFAKHWEVTVQLGVGPRSSLTTMLGYRF